MELKEAVVTIPELSPAQGFPRRPKQPLAPTFLCTVEKWPLNSAAAVGLPSRVIVSQASDKVCWQTLPSPLGLLPHGHSYQQEELFN